MSFTCPDCFWTSANPNDLANLYCGHCHAFTGSAFEPSDIQKVAIKALLARDPFAAIESDILAREVPLAPWSQLLLEFMPLWSAERLTNQQYSALVMLTRKVAQQTMTTK